MLWRLLECQFDFGALPWIAIIGIKLDVRNEIYKLDVKPLEFELK